MTADRFGNDLGDARIESPSERNSSDRCYDNKDCYCRNCHLQLILTAWVAAPPLRILSGDANILTHYNHDLLEVPCTCNNHNYNNHNLHQCNCNHNHNHHDYFLINAFSRNHSSSLGANPDYTTGPQQ